MRRGRQAPTIIPTPPTTKIATAHRQSPWATTPAVHSYTTEPDFSEYEGLMQAYQAEGARPG